ncbi:hypothetical protein JBW_02217 [Pelosinus fermentans JBW45]|uniref:PD-(D/E)XK endonuclease-like domain-containing protein n=2 Tax=Pelosinus TaxID=365348 RepID=I8TZR9_9FIRM|nr:hypothetical protein JBW_02217 [Pelosinus fermentans JBW45]
MQHYAGLLDPGGRHVIPYISCSYYTLLVVALKTKTQVITIYVRGMLKINNPIPLCGKPDVVWKTRDGTLIVGDYKSRENQQVYESEVIQLSVYKLLVERTQKRSVADYGFIHFKIKI